MSENENPAGLEKIPIPDVLEIEILGRMWRMGRVGFSVRREAESRVRIQRREEFKLVMQTISELPEKDKREATILAFDNLLRNVTVSAYESGQWLASATGQEFTIWQSLKAVDEKVAEEDARLFHDSLNAPEMAQIESFLQLKLLT